SPSLSSPSPWFDPLCPLLTVPGPYAGSHSPHLFAGPASQKSPADLSACGAALILTTGYECLLLQLLLPDQFNCIQKKHKPGGGTVLSDTLQLNEASAGLRGRECA